ncbi:hypothetical protein ACKVMT_14665 [Halobacteriales archaeon Cl-PHB]
MESITDAVRAAYDDAGYDVDTVSENRGTVRVALREDDAEADALRSVVEETVDDGSVLGLQVSFEASDADPGVGTVVTFRYRS